MPDGQVITFENDAFRAAEPLFTPSHLTRIMKDPNGGDGDNDGGNSDAKTGDDEDGMDKLLFQSINSINDNNIKDILFNNIILSGGTARLRSVENRLKLEIESMVPMNQAVNIINMERQRKWSTFIGGSILGSLSSFDQLFMKKSDYIENGGNRASNIINNSSSIAGGGWDSNTIFSDWNENVMDGYCCCYFDTIDYTPLKLQNQFEKEKWDEKVTTKFIEYLCFGFIRKNKTNPTDIGNIIVDYFGVYENDDKSKRSIMYKRKEKEKVDRDIANSGDEYLISFCPCMY